MQMVDISSPYSPTFFPSTVRLWNTIPVEIRQIPPDHFKSHLNSIHFSWSDDSSVLSNHTGSTVLSLFE